MESWKFKSEPLGVRIGVVLVALMAAAVVVSMVALIVMLTWWAIWRLA